MAEDLQLVREVAELAAENAARKLSEPIWKELRLMGNRLTSIEQSLRGDNGSGLLAQVNDIRKNCTARKLDCETSFNALRMLASGPQNTVKKWYWMMLGASGALTALGGFLLFLAHMHGAMR